MTVREWIAWKLRCLAWLIYDGEVRQYINILSPDGKTALSVVVVGDDYQYGIDSYEERMPDGWLVQAR